MAISLLNFNSFRVDYSAKSMTKINSHLELIEFFENDNKSVKIIGEGTNLLLTDNLINTSILKIELTNIEFIKLDNNRTLVKAGAGLNWSNLVRQLVSKGYGGGIENLTSIPGSVGASPVQNIGAYGVEIKDFISSCLVYDRRLKKIKELSKEECSFSYRNSIFKLFPERYVIIEISLIVTHANHKFITSYGSLEDKIKGEGISISTLTPLILSDIISMVRSEKLPDTKKIGNAGSFFKNPIVDKKNLDALIKKFPNAPFYKLNNDNFKLSAAWLIETAGFKKFNSEKVGVFEKQALVIINKSRASGKEIFDFSENIIAKVKRQFFIILEREVNVWP